VLGALGERDDKAEICRDRDGSPEPDPELRDTESVPLKKSIEDYFGAVGVDVIRRSGNGPPPQEVPQT